MDYIPQRGDKVKCINKIRSKLKLNKIYEVYDVEHLIGGSIIAVNVFVKPRYNIKRFRLVNLREEKLDRILKNKK